MGFCEKHGSKMTLYTYYRTNHPPRDEWVCLQCQKERESIERGELKYQPTRFPEGAEL